MTVRELLSIIEERNDQHKYPFILDWEVRVDLPDNSTSKSVSVGWVPEGLSHTKPGMIIIAH